MQVSGRPPAHVGGRREIIVVVRDRSVVEKTAREVRPRHAGAGTDFVDRRDAEMSD